MKKLILLILAALLLLASCGGRKGDTEESKNSDSKVTTGTNVITGTVNTTGAEGTAGAQELNIPIEEALFVPEGEIREEIDSVLKSNRPDTAKGEIRWATISNSGELTAGLHCYGIFNGCVVYFSILPVPTLWCITVANCKFAYPSLFSINVYRDGEIHRLADAYNKGIITEAEIALIAQRHKTVTDYLYGSGAHNGFVSQGFKEISITSGG